MGRRILFITTDQQRYDSLGCTGGTIARTPVLDALAAEGITYERAHANHVVCMPNRATMVTGQAPQTHGVWMNGVPLPADAPSVAAELHAAGYRTALVGKAHFEPFIDPHLTFSENRMGVEGTHGPHRGFEHMELATHGAMGFTHYAQWMATEHPDRVGDFYRVLDGSLEVSAEAGGDTGAPQVKLNPIPRELYHTDWVADRTIAWLDGLAVGDDWFAWMSFPDPHHPWDPPASERRRVPWRDLDLPAAYPRDRARREALLDARPRHWRDWYDGSLVPSYESPPGWVPATLTADQVREVNAAVHVEVELIDEAIGRVLHRIEERGWGDDVDVVFTTDHGELQGDHGLLFKGPYHVDALLRLPLIWRPARSHVEPVPPDVPPDVPGEARPGGVRVPAPVATIDLAPTFCAIAGLEPPSWMEGRVLPRSPAEAEAQERQRALTTWDSVGRDGTAIHLRTIYRDRFLLTACLPGSEHDGTEGELYDTDADPRQWVNRWDDPALRGVRDALLADLRDHLPVEPAVEQRRPVFAPV